jgi:hypothetical protein
VRAQAGELRGHHRPGRAFRVRTQPQDVAALVGRQHRQQFIDDLGVDAFQNIDAFVRRQVGNQVHDLRTVDRLDALDLFLRREVAEDLHPRRWAGVPQHLPRLGRGQPFHELRRTRRVQRNTELLQLGRVVLGQHLAKFGQIEGIGHGRAADGSRCPGKCKMQNAKCKMTNEGEQTPCHK